MHLEAPKKVGSSSFWSDSIYGIISAANRLQ